MVVRRVRLLRWDFRKDERHDRADQRKSALDREQAVQKFQKIFGK